MNRLRGLIDAFTTVDLQVYDVNFRTQVPRKELIWFENSAHTPRWDEPVHFVDVMGNIVLAQTLPHTPEADSPSAAHRCLA